MKTQSPARADSYHSIPIQHEPLRVPHRPRRDCHRGAPARNGTIGRTTHKASPSLLGPILLRQLQILLCCTNEDCLSRQCDTASQERVLADDGRLSNDGVMYRVLLSCTPDP